MGNVLSPEQQKVVLQNTHLHISETVKPWCDIVEDASHGSVKGESKAEKDGEDEVGEDGGEVDRLAQALHPLDQSQEDYEPGEDQATNQLQTNSSHLRIMGDFLMHLPVQCQGTAQAFFL